MAWLAGRLLAGVNGDVGCQLIIASAKSSATSAMQWEGVKGIWELKSLKGQNHATNLWHLNRNLGFKYIQFSKLKLFGTFEVRKEELAHNVVMIGFHQCLHVCFLISMWTVFFDRFYNCLWVESLVPGFFVWVIWCATSARNVAPAGMIVCPMLVLFEVSYIQDGAGFFHGQYPPKMHSSPPL